MADYSGKSCEDRIRDRLRPSGPMGTHRVTAGEGPTRTVTTVHEHGHQHNHGKPSYGERAADKREEGGNRE
jgi:hypothetical protein